MAHVHHEDPAELVPLGRYRAELLGRFAPLPPMAVGLLEARGAVLAEDVRAAADIPAFANSAMDGYAVRAAEVTAGTVLDVVGERAAGAGLGAPVEAGQAVRIMTGAPVPPGADAIVPVEVADEADGRVVLRHGPSAGDHVRPAGEDVGRGETVLRAGRVLGAADVGMLAAVGRASVRVYPRPRVVVVPTGDELREPGEPLPPGAIRDANGYALTALASESGAEATRWPIVRDDLDALRAAFRAAVVDADVVVTTGGVSAGRYDFVKVVLDELGDVAAVKVGVQPGMPQAFGFLSDGGRRVACFGLPGNPVSAYVSFELLVRPALRRLAGHGSLARPRVTAVLDEPVSSPPGRVSFLRVRLSRAEGDPSGGPGWRARPTGGQGSGILRSVVDADGLAEVPAGDTSLPAGTVVVVHLLGDRDPL